MKTPVSSQYAQETELITRLRCGDPTAMEQIFKTHFDRLFSLVFYQVGRNREIAEDIVQDTFLSALNVADSFRGESRLYTWLCGIAYHKIADFYRQQRRAIDYSKVTIIDTITAEKASINSPSIPSQAESEETRQAINDALSSLPLDYRQVLIFKYVEEMSVHVISNIMRRSPKSVEGLLSRGRAALRKILTDSGEGFKHEKTTNTSKGQRKWITKKI